MADVVVEGLAELRAAFTELGRLDKRSEFAHATETALERVVLPEAKDRAGDVGRMEQAAAQTLTLTATGDGVGIVFDGSVEFGLGSEFGARHDVPRTTPTRVMAGWNQFEEWRGDSGYFLNPTIEESGDRLVDEIDRGLDPFFDRIWS